MVAENQVITQPCREIFKALSDETRWLIVRELLVKPLTVGELAERLSVSSYNVSKHLRVLRECHILIMTKEGRHVRARVNPALEPSTHPEEGAEKVLELGCCEIRFSPSDAIVAR